MRRGKVDVQGDILSPRLNTLEDNIILNTFRLQIQNSLSLVNLEDGIVETFTTLDANIENIGDGWYKCSTKANSSTTTAICVFFFLNSLKRSEINFVSGTKKGV